MRFRDNQEVPEYEASQRGRQRYSNAADHHYDIAAYEADGGDSVHRYQEIMGPGLISNPGKVDEALWEKAKRASEEAFGRIKYPFVSWWYKKQGGTFG